MSEIRDIPNGWNWIRLGDLVDNQKQDLVDGPFGSNLKSAEYVESGVPVFKIQNIKDNKFIDKKMSFVTHEKAQTLIRHSFKTGDLIITKLGEPLGLCCKVPPQYPFGIIVADLMRLRPSKSKVFDEYLIYAINSDVVKKQLKLITKGTTRSRVNLTIVRDIKIPVPLLLSEQQAIVAKIEELLSELDNGKQQLQTAQQQLKVYRQSLLKWAFEGKLTHKNVKEGELPDGWAWVKSGELFSFVTSGSRGWAKYYSHEGAIFIRITNMDFDTLDLNLSEAKIQYVNPPSNSEGIRTKVQEGDFLFSITGYLGMFAIAPKLENAFVNQHVCLCRPKDGFNKKYVGYWIVSKSGGIHYLNKIKKGAVKAGLNLDDLKNFPIPLASIEEQQLIVDELESKLTVCDKLEETINQSLQQAETLRQSILKQAFAGKLV